MSYQFNSILPQEREVLFDRGSVFQVDKIIVRKGKTPEIFLKEM